MSRCMVAATDDDGNVNLKEKERKLFCSTHSLFAKVDGKGGRGFLETIVYDGIERSL